MAKHIKTYQDFISPVFESDGFGTSPYLLEKVEGIYHYFFNLEFGESGNSKGFHLIVGKYSDKEIIEGAKNSYCVLSINEISPERIEDIAIDKSEIPPKNAEKFKISSELLSRLLKYVYLCVQNYLETNPKVSRIYDELQDNLVYKGEGSYLEYAKSLAIDSLGSGWSIQSGSHAQTVLLSR